MRVLKPGGELYFADVFSDRRLPPALMQDPVLLGECLAGALYVEDFRRLLGSWAWPMPASARAARSHCTTRRSSSGSALPASNRSPGGRSSCRSKIAARTTVRSPPIWAPSPGIRIAFDLDDHHHFETGRPLRVCGNTADMLGASRYVKHLRIDGNKQRHFGLFDCAPAAVMANEGAACC